MPSCDFCGDSFENKRELRLHWGEEHEDELNSHKRDQVKKARKQQERLKEQQAKKRRQRRKTLGGYAIAGLLLLGIGFAIVQNAGSITGLISGSTPTEVDGLDLSDAHYIGGEDADVAVVEFGDFRCPHCGTFDSSTYPQLKSDFIDTGEIRFYYKHLPVIDPRHRSEQAAAAMECVAQQDYEAAYQFKTTLYTKQGESSVSDADYQTTGFYTGIAEEIEADVNTEELRSCIESGDMVSNVDRDSSMAQSVGARSTPTVMVVNLETDAASMVNNWQSYDQLTSQIEAMQ